MVAAAAVFVVGVLMVAVVVVEECRTGRTTGFVIEGLDIDIGSVEDEARRSVRGSGSIFSCRSCGFVFCVWCLLFAVW